MIEPSHNLGIAGRMAQSFIHSPLSLLLFIAMFLMGLMGLKFTPRQEDPQISVPMVDIFVQYQGASSKQVASLAIDPLQRIMSEIPGVEHVYSAAERGQGVVTVQFEVGEQLEDSIFKVHDKIQSNKEKMPPGVSEPLVKAKGIDDVPVVNLTLWSEDVDDGVLRTLALDVMQNLKEIPNTGQSFIIGGRSEQVRIEVIPERLSGYGISLDQVANTIRTANSEKNAGSVESAGTHFSVRTGQFLENAEDIAELVVGTHGGAAVHVRDIATVIQGPEETKQIVNYFSGQSYGYESHREEAEAGTYKPNIRVDGAPAVTIAVAKKIGSNGVTVAESIIEHIENLKGRVIPDNVHIEITRDYGKTANDKVNDLIKKLFIATGAVTVLVWFALGIRPAIVVTLVIPVVILITVFSAWILGYTIDRVSLFALIFSIGILVDDAIVVIENIYRRWLIEGETNTETAVDAVREVGNPTILATFTVVAALLPMGFVSGMMGPYMEPIPALGSVAMIFSLFAAFIFTPWLAMRIKPSLKSLEKAEKSEHRLNNGLEWLFRKILPPLFSSRLWGGLFYIALIASFIGACAMFYTRDVEVKMLPLDNKPEFNVFINMPEGTALFDTASVTHEFVERMREAIPEITALQSYVGTSQPFDFNGMVRHYYLRQKSWEADIHVQLKDKTDRVRTSHQIATEARRLLQEVLGERPVKFTVVEMPPGPPVLQSIVAEVYGPDDKTRQEVASKMTEIFEKAEIVSDVDNYMIQPYDVWRFEVNTKKAIESGVSVDTINRNLSMALGNFVLGDIKRGTVLEPTFITVQVPLAMRTPLSRLYDLPIPTNTGGTVPLGELGVQDPNTFQPFLKESQDPIIYQKDLRPMEYVVGDPVGIYEGNNEYSLSAPIYGMFEIEALLKDYETPDKINLVEPKKEDCIDVYVTDLCLKRYVAPPTIGQSGFEWTGEWTITYETFRDMGLAFMVAMVLIYILVVWLFGNFIVPAIIMLPIPLTLLGIIPGHWMRDAEFTATSMIGWIALAGIIVRNSILLVDYSIHAIEKGVCIEDAVILACKTRTRPIMITALALVAGSFVILTDPIFEGMAISLLFGVMVSTILTLVVIPLGCISIGPKALCASGLGGTTNVPDYIANLDKSEPADLSSTSSAKSSEPKTPLWLTIWSKIIGFFMVVFYIIRAVFIIIGSMFSSIKERIFSKKEALAAPPPSSSAPSPTKPPEKTEPPAPESVAEKVAQVIESDKKESESKIVESTEKPKVKEIKAVTEELKTEKVESVAEPEITESAEKVKAEETDLDSVEEVKTVDEPEVVESTKVEEEFKTEKAETVVAKPQKKTRTRRVSKPKASPSRRTTPAKHGRGNRGIRLNMDLTPPSPKKGKGKK